MLFLKIPLSSIGLFHLHTNFMNCDWYFIDNISPPKTYRYIKVIKTSDLCVECIIPFGKSD